MLKYGKLENIISRLSGRITVLNTEYTDMIGVTGTSIGYKVITVIGEAVEEFMDMYLGMVYIMPLINEHPFLSSIAEKLIVAETYLTYFPTSLESNANTDSFSSNIRMQALNDFQCLFNGLGIFVPGVENNTLSSLIQNEASQPQMQNKALILPGETVKKFIGYDYDEDGSTDTDLFKSNTNVNPSFYMTGDFEDFETGNEEVVNNVRVKPRRYSRPGYAEVDFYEF